MRRRLACLLVPILWGLSGSTSGQIARLLEQVPAGLGVDIHFTAPKAGEMEMLAAGGFTWVRTDLSWRATEPAPGVYDFTRYDGLWTALAAQHVSAILTLDYGNPLYDGGWAPHTDTGRAAFAAWAQAAVSHFRGRPVLWELYNEPNTGFWKPAPNVSDYIRLAKLVGPAIHAADPTAVFIGPATSGFDFTFLDACFQAGLLQEWSAVTVHPYRSSGPETASADYQRLRMLIAQHVTDRQIPILSGEWGYSTSTPGIDEAQQGNLLARQWLSNLMNGVPLSIWYDWRDDGPPGSSSAQAHYGTVLQPYLPGTQPVFSPKPAYFAAQVLTATLYGFQFSRRLPTASQSDFVLEFKKHDGTKRYALWTTGPPHPLRVSDLQGSFQWISVDGHTNGSLPATTGQGIEVEVQAAPVYLIPN